MNQHICVVIPVYNEEEVISGVIGGLLPHFGNIICVDDGSSDNSVEKILATDARLVKHGENRGQGAAIRTGIEEALLDRHVQYIATFDADGQHRVEDLLLMAKTIERTGKDIVLGSRFLGSTEDISILKKGVLKLAVRFSNLTTGLKLTDTHNGLRVFNRQVGRALRLRCSGMAHASEIVYRIRENHFSYQEVPVTIRYTDYSKAKGQSVLNAFNILRELVSYRLQKEQD
jgi:glycosyltransferase involved in cell wall biosynthesis